MSLTVIAPSYLKAASLDDFLTRLSKSLNNHGQNYEIIVVIDGDTDQSSQIIDNFHSLDPRVKCIVHETNLGKGAAIRTGVNGVRECDFIAYLDADLDIHPEVISNYVTFLKGNLEVDILYASKRHQLSLVQYPLGRKVMSYIFQKMVRLLLAVDVEDTQTGLKMGRYNAMKDSILNTDTNGFAFDLEFFVNAKQAGYRFAAMPVRLDFQFTSTINISHVIRIFSDLLRISFWRKRHGSFSRVTDN